MTGTQVVLWILLGNIIMSIFAAWVALTKGRNSSWAFLTLLFGIIALIAVAGAPMLEEEEEREVERQKAAGRRRKADREVVGRPWIPGQGPPPE